jgi:uncharacterized protein DUF5946
MEMAYNELQGYTLGLGDERFIHQHVVDAWMAQHADERTKPIGLTFALVGLYLHVQRGFSGRQVQRAHMFLARRKRTWPSFPLPEDLAARAFMNIRQEAGSDCLNDRFRGEHDDLRGRQHAGRWPISVEAPGAQLAGPRQVGASFMLYEASRRERRHGCRIGLLAPVISHALRVENPIDLIGPQGLRDRMVGVACGPRGTELLESLPSALCARPMSCGE